MGQKTHPVGFRLQINKNWRSTWFAGKSFTTGLEEDLRIRKYLKARIPNPGISKVEESGSTIQPMRQGDGQIERARTVG